MSTDTPTAHKLAEALAKAQAQITGATKDATNPHFKSRYADLAAVWEACRKPLTDNGLSVVQPVRHSDAGALLVTRIMHASGESIEDGGIPLLLSKEDMQGLGSALTYARRYGLMAMVGIAPEDDDGNAASSGNGKPVASRTRRPPPPPARVDTPVDEERERRAELYNAAVTHGEWKDKKTANEAAAAFSTKWFGQEIADLDGNRFDVICDFLTYGGGLPPGYCKNDIVLPEDVRAQLQAYLDAQGGQAEEAASA